MAKAKKTPDPVDDAEDPNLVDSNGAPSAMDEDGNYAPESDDVLFDNSPVLHNFIMRTTHPKDSALCMVELQAMIHTPLGMVSKRLVLSGELTAEKLIQHLGDVASW